MKDILYSDLIAKWYLSILNSSYLLCLPPSSHLAPCLVPVTRNVFIIQSGFFFVSHLYSCSFSLASEFPHLPKHSRFMIATLVFLCCFLRLDLVLLPSFNHLSSLGYLTCSLTSDVPCFPKPSLFYSLLLVWLTCACHIIW